MSYLKTVDLISSYTPEYIDWIGKPVKASGYYGPNGGTHTLAIKTVNYTGMIFIDGTLSINPGECDWFPILFAGKDGLTFGKEFINNDPDWISIGFYGTTETIGFTFYCNCLFLRARMIRNYLISPYATGLQISTYGSIDTIIVSY